MITSTNDLASQASLASSLLSEFAQPIEEEVVETADPYTTHLQAIKVRKAMLENPGA
jgi:hypothetical protein